MIAEPPPANSQAPGPDLDLVTVHFVDLIWRSGLWEKLIVPKHSQCKPLANDPLLDCCLASTLYALAEFFNRSTGHVLIGGRYNLQYCYIPEPGVVCTRRRVLYNHADQRLECTLYLRRLPASLRPINWLGRKRAASWQEFQYG